MSEGDKTPTQTPNTPVRTTRPKQASIQSKSTVVPVANLITSAATPSIKSGSSFGSVGM
jgi:hypothetical protein